MTHYHRKNSCCDNKNTNLLVYLVAAFTVDITYMITFGISGRGLIFMYTFQLVCYSLYITTTVSGKEKMAVWWLVGFHIMLLLNQLPYMVQVQQGESFVIFFTTVLTCLTVWLLISAIRSTSDLYRSQGVKPEYLIEDRLYLVVKRPKDWSDYFISLFGSPVSSVSFSIGSNWIRYTKKEGTAERCDVLKSAGFTFLNTGVTVSDVQIEHFNKMEHKEWSWSRNCVTAWEPVLDNTPYEHKPWEWFPSVYVSRVIHLVQQEENICS